VIFLRTQFDHILKPLCDEGTKKTAAATAATTTNTPSFPLFLVPTDYSIIFFLLHHSFDKRRKMSPSNDKKEGCADRAPRMCDGEGSRRSEPPTTNDAMMLMR
jgi:hypothetical protein